MRRKWYFGTGGICKSTANFQCRGNRSRNQATKLSNFVYLSSVLGIFALCALLRTFQTAVFVITYFNVVLKLD